MERKSLYVTVAIGIAAVCFAGQVHAQPSVVTDKADYNPGETVQIYGTGFQPSETVQLQVLRIDGTPNSGEGHEPSTVIVGANGEFYSTWFVPWDDSAGATFELTAVGLSSGLIA